MLPSHKSVKDKKESIKDVLRQRKKESKKKLKEKRARLVVKNLPFNTTEEDLKQHFNKFGDVLDVNILKKEDGKLTGCAFIQYKLVQKAKKAQFHTNGKNFMDRKIVVDFAMSKKEYVKLRYNKEVKKEEDKTIEVKTEPIDEEVNPKEEVEEEKKVNEDENNSDINESNGDVDEDSSLYHEVSENEELSDEEMDVDEDDSRQSKPRVVSNDVSEGKTVFIKNVPFSATNEDLQSCMEKYGPIYYALICKDKYTEHSKGTAFVKFCLQEDAEKVLQAGTELTLLGNVLDCHKALNRNEIQSKQENKGNEKKDSRNLYLVREGVILPDSAALKGVSKTDLAKRIRIEEYKTQMLKNLNMFVSRERLVVHNLPLTWDDKKFRELCKKFAGEGAKIKEARIMRNMRDIGLDGLGKSKGFGFVTLDSHESALTLLRGLNNNPNVFSAQTRPIVTFSIERKTAIKAKLKRLERSRLKNPISKQYDPKLVLEEEKQKKEKAKKEAIANKSNPEENLPTYSGIPAKPGSYKRKNRQKEQAGALLASFKKNNKKMAVKKTLKDRIKDFTKQEKQKIKRKDDSDAFSKMVSQYKKTLTNAPSIKQKWFS